MKVQLINQFPSQPRCFYLTAMDMQDLAPPTDMLAMQILPDRSWSATVRNRARPDPILETN